MEVIWIFMVELEIWDELGFWEFGLEDEQGFL